jgi:acid phosphatase
LSEIKQAVIAYHDNGQYERDLEGVDDAAAAYVAERADKVKNPALVLDIDETALSNWERLLANEFAYFAAGPCDKLPAGPCGGVAFNASGRATAILPTLRLAKMAAEHHVAVFFITGRYEAERAATEKNLRSVGYPEWVQLFMRPDGTKTASAADYKRPQRERIAQMGYTIVANVGDQPSDLAGGFTERGFLLPDPFYRVP